MTENNVLAFPREHEDRDIIDDLLRLQERLPRPYRDTIGRIAREAAAEIQRLRGKLGELDESPHVDFARQTIIDRDGRAWRMQSHQWTVLDMLLRNAGRIVRNEELIHALYGHDPNGGPLDAFGCLKVTITRLRKRSPWPIRCQWGVGYVLEGYQPASPSRLPSGLLVVG